MRLYNPRDNWERPEGFARARVWQPFWSLIVLEFADEMGRKAKYLTESTGKRAKRERRGPEPNRTIYLSKVFSAWTDAKRATDALISDSAFATILLDW